MKYIIVGFLAILISLLSPILPIIWWVVFIRFVFNFILGWYVGMGMIKMKEQDHF